jgi:hypothetical protein
MRAAAQAEADKLTAAHAALRQKFAELQRCGAY